MASAKAAIRLSMVVVVIDLSLCVCSSVVDRVRQLEIPVGACPPEHTTPPLRCDTIRARGGVSDIVGES